MVEYNALRAFRGNQKLTCVVPMVNDAFSHLFRIFARRIRRVVRSCRNER